MTGFLHIGLGAITDNAAFADDISHVACLAAEFTPSKRLLSPMGNHQQQVLLPTSALPRPQTFPAAAYS